MNSLSIFNPLFADSVLDSLNHDSPHFGVFSPLANASYPTVDVRETSGAYIMDIDLPGYTEKDVTIHLKERVLTVASNHEETKEKEEKPNGEQFLIRERTQRHFVRRFTLPEDIDQDKVEASFKNGVLTVTIPRKELAPRRQIAIKSN
ncbi:MAG: Hsp20/alpha crystallin family protein [Treponema sp.]|jgi:spore protein SP21|uniref:Hsp20/alpha crystallin family protein n=1 Tax=Treponema vincentii TaxID=69710 RepID=A0A6P1Y3J5_9SPIR|nr:MULTISPECIES: Hsp20/alpha crystallin family protein [Treponema]QHX44348.1 Hsp20/alpha crystallin family protein [Treponema vincentii]UTC53065.1 Hsp20/alpha crystallin family protein [Treponema sp. OMZ 803]UTC55492.1 Hsp20/alpha crystallin family protein [Treponema sp. OMZ 906]